MAKHTIMKTGILFVWMVAALTTLADERSVSFDIQGDGKRVENAEVLFFGGNNIFGSFVSVTNDPVKFDSKGNETSVEYLIRAPGFAIKSGILPRDFSKPFSVNLDAGMTVELKIEGYEKIPQDFLPVVFPEKVLQDAAFSMDARVSHSLLRIVDVRPDELHPGTFHFHANRDELFRVLVHHPGYLRGFVSDSMKPSERMGLKLPKPCGLQAVFHPRFLRETEKALVVAFKSFPEAHANVTMVYEQNAEAISGDWSDLAPGNYRVEAAEINPANFNTRTEEIEDVHLSAGENRNLTLVPADEQMRFKGDSTIKIQVKNFEGKRLSNALYEFSFFDTNTIATLSVACGRTTETGEIVLNNFKSGTNAPRFRVKINGVSQSVQFTDANKDQVVEFSLPPTSGDFAPRFEGKDLLTGASKVFPNGNYVILDFWAVSCGACQNPMADINDVWRRKSMEWTNKVDVIAINLDDTKEEALKRIAEKHWEGISHVWEPGDFNSVTAKKYHVPWLPISLIIGPNGQILWTGDPREMHFEQAIDALLSGKLKPEKLISSQRNWLDAD